MNVLLILLLGGVFAKANAQRSPNVKVECARDGIVIKVKKRILQRTGYEMGELHLNDHGCVLDEEDGEYYLKRISPLTTCGTLYHENATHVVYLNVVSTLPPEINGLYDFTRRRHALSATFKCTYKIDLKVSAMFRPNITIVDISLPPSHGTGEFQASMALYKDQSYLSPYARSEAPVLPADSTLYVGVALRGGKIGNDIYLLVEECWATPFEDPDSEPQHGLIKHGCALATGADEMVKIEDNGNAHQVLWETAAFKFNEFGNKVWLHCDLQVCLHETCEPVSDKELWPMKEFTDFF